MQAGGWGGVVGGASSRNARSVEAEGGARAERTANMDRMSVTLDVLMLSGWLNADALCRARKHSKRATCRLGEAWGRRRGRKQRAGRHRGRLR